MRIAIDGPAGAGKSTVARAVAGALGYTYLDSGAMYRSAALAQPKDPASLHIAFDGERVLLDGDDVTAAIRTPEISQAASRLATDPAVRGAMVAKQRALLRDGDWVAEGRDIGTVVAPDAPVKVYLTADPAARAARRSAEQSGADVAATQADLLRRDGIDSGRAVSPLAMADDAHHIDTTPYTLDEVVDQIVVLVQKAQTSES